MIINDDPIPPTKKDYRTIVENLGIKIFAVFAIVFTIQNIDTTAITAGEAIAQEVYVATPCTVQNGIYKSDTQISGLQSYCQTSVINFDPELEMRTQQYSELLAGHPMETMAPILATKDPAVAAFVIGIGKIESNWGKRSPWKSGIDCYNYWGYKTSGTRGQALGHACFGSPQEAVDTIATRLDYFVNEQGRDTASKLLVWKCGRSCATHDPVGVARWVNVVERYAHQAEIAVVDDSLAQFGQPLILTRR